MKNKSLMGTALPFLTVVASLSFSSCQDEDFGYDQSDIRQAYLNRKYAEEFKKQFPNADPNHTWMCDPDTFGIESLIDTRAYPAGMMPQVQKTGNTSTVSADFITGALNKLPEGKDNRGIVTQSFDYLAVDDDGSSNSDNYSEFIITPTFWGRKFCGANSAGIYWFDNNGYKHDEQIFWWDYNGGHGIKVTYANNVTEPLVNSEYPINCDITWTNYKYDYPLGKPCPVCADLHDGTAYLKYDAKRDNADDSKWNADVTMIDKYDAKCIELVSKENPSTEWDTRLRVKTSGTWNAGETYKFHMEYLCDWGWNSSNINFQLQSENNEYIWGASTGQHLMGTNQGMSLSRDGNGDFHWVDFEFTFTIPNDKNGAKQICLDLNPINNEGNPAGSGKTVWVKNVSCVKQNCSNCHGEGYYPATKYILPQYLVKIPVGMKWGVFFDTKKQQTDNSEFTRYYSNAELNQRTDKFEKTGIVYAAATYVSDNITYCCFEDAATNLHDGGPVGTCGCGYGHYDTDYNDFVFSIQGRPVTNSYQAVKYRIMCEDLGGTYDWDFNDVVYDVVYEEDPQGNNNATVKVLLRAVGGTYPVYMQFKSQFDSENIIQSCSLPYGNDNSRLDLHNKVYNQKTDINGLYLPVNVAADATQKTEWYQNPYDRVLCTYTLNAKKYSGLDARRFVELITIYVNQDPKKSNTTTAVTFPTQKGGTNKIPECFMTSINTGWTNEHENIANRFYGFMNWVGNHNSNKKWWEDGIGM